MKNTLKNTNLLFIFLSFFIINFGIFISDSISAYHWIPVANCPEPMIYKPSCAEHGETEALCNGKIDDKLPCKWIEKEGWGKNNGLCVRDSVYVKEPFSDQDNLALCENGKMKNQVHFMLPSGFIPPGNHPVLMSDLDYDCSEVPKVGKNGAYIEGNSNVKHDLRVQYFPLDGSGLSGLYLDKDAETLRYNGHVSVPRDPNYIYVYDISGYVIVQKDVNVGDCYGVYGYDGGRDGYLSEKENYMIYVKQRYMGNIDNPNADGRNFQKNLGGAGSGLGINIPNSKYPDKVINPYK